ncbi:hypothetical protein SAMN05216188_13090 [Lentzea xinjiangensis]|uniref:Roadblock/LAMTOR2 domain-containing protein n=1 Tax=Lentzea xinjiangensis TaxID=402600 RepID=A0A1H9W4Y4_9PSEU|nr:roadblock/LC7 domain-containing protein [Lentzea xinjiangensis]SES29016.1 hypothetical protein SAMN05216188_13090 [Lentzea xinjiangensis]
MTTADMTTAAAGWNWPLDDFVTRTARVSHAIVLSADGLLVARSRRLPKDRADQLAAVISGLVSLAQGAAKCFDAGTTRQCVVEMERGFLLVNSVADGSSIGVLAGPDADLGVVGYEVTKLVGLFGEHLTPDVRTTPFAAGAGG